MTVMNFDLSGNEYKLLSYIVSEGHIDFDGEWLRYVYKVCKGANMSTSTLYRTLNKLQDKGLIIRSTFSIRYTEEVKLKSVQE